MKAFKLCVRLTLLAAWLGFALQASGLTIGDIHDLGLISPNHPADPYSSAGYTDTLLGQPLGSGPTTIGPNQYTRTTNDPLGGVYPTAVFSVDLGVSTSIDLGTGYQYLLAKYDGPNFGSEVWYVGNLSGTISIPAFGSDEQYGLSHVYLYNPNGAVPDGGTTLLLLGTALSGLGLLRRFVS
jgi:VPDSG-CTERM motif